MYGINYQLIVYMLVPVVLICSSKIGRYLVKAGYI